MSDKEKTKKASISDAVVEKTTDKILQFIREMVNEQKEKEDEKEMNKEDKFVEQIEMAKKEYERIIKEMQKEKPDTDRYSTLAHNLYQIKNLLTGWY